MATEGERYRLTRKIGEVGSLEAGWVGEVVGVIPDGETGGGSGADHLVLWFWEQGRNVSFTDEQLAEWFEAVE